MTRISSKYLGLTKQVFPLMWFGFLAFFVAVAILDGAVCEEPIFFVGPCVMAVFGYFLMRTLVWDLADHVYDCGDHLLVRKGKDEEKVLLSNIMNVRASTFTNPPRITLRLARAGRFGTEVSFSPVSPFTLIHMTGQDKDLIEKACKSVLFASLLKE